MRSVSLVACGLFFCLGNVGCDFLWESVDGSGREAREERDVGPFTAVQVTDSLQADVTLDPEAAQRVEVRGDDNLVPLVSARVEDGTLILELPESLGIRPKLPLVVTISAEALTRVEATDSARLTANRLDGASVTAWGADSVAVTVGDVTAAKSLTLGASDSATVTLGGAGVGGPVWLSAQDSAVVDVTGLAADGQVSVDAEDSSHVAMEGGAPALIADLRDSSSLDAERLTVAQAVLRGDSSSEADVCVTDTLDVTLSDSSAVRYACDPATVTQDLDGSSTLAKK